MKNLCIALACSAAIAAAAPASAVVIDFDTETADNVASFAVGSVTFSSPGGNIFTTSFGNTPNGTRGIIGNDNGGAFTPLRADIAGGTGSVSVDIGDFNADTDNIFLQAFDAANVLLDSDSTVLPGNFVGLQTLSVNAANIAYVLFGGVGVSGSSVYGDNFTFDDAAVPEPATWAMMIGGFGLAGLSLRSKRRTPAIA